VTRPLRSTGITRLHHYYGAVRTWLAHRYSRGVATCAFSLPIADLKFRAKARIRVTPPIHRTPHGQSAGVCSSRSSPRFWCHLKPFDASSEVRLRSSPGSIH